MKRIQKKLVALKQSCYESLWWIIQWNSFVANSWGPVDYYLLRQIFNSVCPNNEMVTLQQIRNKHVFLPMTNDCASLRPIFENCSLKYLLIEGYKFNKYLILKSIKFLQSLSTAGNFLPPITIALSRVTLN